MRRILFSLALLCASISAAPLLTLNPSNGQISGAQGSTIGWGFNLTGDQASWVLITNVQSDVNLAAIGTFQDLLSNWFANNSFALAPGGSLNDTTAGNLASVALSAGAPLGPVSGNLLVSYELYDGNPFVGGNFLSPGSLTNAFTITVTPIPEPATGLLVAAALIALSRIRRR
jgi:hypothetical protein